MVTHSECRQVSGKQRHALCLALPALVTLAISAVLLFVGLGNNAFWDDEANTALFARNLLQVGRLTAWDGTNLVGFRMGAELDAQLMNVYMPPLQYHLAAAGFRVLGFSTVAGRIPFVLCGLLSIAAVVVAARYFLRSARYSWLPAALIGLNPAYLMFMRQCRYYALATLLTVLLMAMGLHPKPNRHGVWGAAAFGFIAAGALMMTNYINAAAIAVSLPVLLIQRRYRNRKNVIFLIACWLGAALVGTYFILKANPLDASVSYKSTISGTKRLALLIYWHVTGLARFEFFPHVVVVLLPLMLWWQRRRQGLVRVKDGLVILLILFVYTLAVVAFSPQSVAESTYLADMRYVVPLIPLGALATAQVLILLWNRGRGVGALLAVCLGLLLVSSNVFTSAVPGWAPLRSTLVQYVRENTRDYTTGNEAVINYLKGLPKSKIVRIVPDFMAYPSMFYVPRHHYCCQLDEQHPLDASIQSKLPDYVYMSRNLPDLIFVGANITAAQLKYQADMLLGPGRYRLGPVVGDEFRECSRPELPWHCFEPPTGAHQGFYTLELVTSRNWR